MIIAENIAATNKKTEEIRVLAKNERVNGLLENHIQQKVKTEGLKHLNILEAGCGRRWMLKLVDIEYKLTGVDLDADALAFRNNVMKDLDEAIVGDLCSVNLEEKAYDMIFNAYVLEHVQGADKMLENFVQWLKKDGLLVLQLPDRNSAYGFLTRMTPHWVHVMYTRYLSPWKFKDSGKKGFGPYPTYHEPVVSKEGIRQFAQENKLSIEAEYALNYYIQRNSSVTALLLQFVVTVISLISFGKLDSRYNNLVYVLKKTE